MRASDATERDDWASKAAPASTGWLIVSILFANKLWISDATSMSLYWVARLPIPRVPFRSPLAPKNNGDAVISIAPNISRRSRKIALSLAIVGALASPFAFGTYKADPQTIGFQPLSVQRQKEVIGYLTEHNYCRDLMEVPMDKLPVSADVCFHKLGLLRQGEYFSDFSIWKFLVLNLVASIAGFVVIFGLAYLVPMLVWGFAFSFRRYWKWLNA